jgi:two-component system, cell cycle sensor histidine kinase and response regulator CckA
MIQHPAVFEAVRDAIFLADIDSGMIVDANPAAEALSGRTLAELQLFHPTQLHPPEVEKIAGSWFAKDSQAPVLTEGLVLHKDGGRIPVEISSKCFSTPDGRRMWVGVFRDLTERKLADVKLKESEDRFRATFSQAAVGIAQTDVHGHWMFLNDRFCEILGYSRAELARKTFPEITHPDDCEVCFIAIRRLLSGESSSWSTEKRYLRKDGAIIWANCVLSLVRDEHGEAQYFIVIVEDITQRIEVERALRQTEQRLVLAQSAAHLGVWYRSWEANAISISGEYACLHGLPSDRTMITREEWFSTIHPDDQERVDALRREGRERRNTFEAEYRVIWPDGSRHWVMAKGAVLLDGLGQPIGSTGVNMDITERKKAEAALRESEQRFRNMADSAPVLVWVSGIDQQRNFFNKPWLDFTGRSIDQELGSGWASGVHPDDLDRCLATYSSSFDARCAFQVEYRLRRFDGDYRWVLDNSTPLYRDGEFAGFIGSCIDVTNQKLMADRLRAQTVQFKHAQRLAKVGSWERDVETGSINWSDEMLRIFGQSNPPPTLAAFLDHVHPKDREKVLAGAAEVRSSISPVEVSYRIIRPDGEERFVRAVVEMIRDSQGKPVRTVGSMQDITEHKRAEAALRESEGRFRKLADTVPVMIWLTGPDKALTFVNKTWLDFRGRTMEQELRDGWAAGIHPDDLESVRDISGAAFDARGNFQLECRLQRADGEYRLMLYNGIPRFGQDDVFAGYIGSNIDITNSQSEERFRQLAANIDQVLWMQDIATSRVIYVSPAYEKVWGASPAALYENRLRLLETVYPEDRPLVAAAMANTDPLPFELTYRIARPDGTVRWIVDRVFAIRDLEGKPYRMVGIAEDVTANRELEEQLRQAHKMEAVGRLAGGVAHDFNNLLTVIGGYSQMLLNSAPAAGPSRDKLEQIVNAANRASSLTRQLLTFSRCQMWQPRVVSLNRLLTDMEPLLRPLIGEHITIETVFAPELSCVKVDPHQIEQVVMNLATNARDAMPKGGRFRIQTVTASIAAAGANDSASGIAKCVRLRISDTGCGMDERTRERAFEPFFTTKGVGKGTGLGLSTVYGIVRQNQGEIHVSSELGRGTVFDLYFPSVPEREAESELSPNQLPKSAGTETILVAEDELGVRELVKQTLEQLGYRVLEAADGYEALRVVEQHASHIHLLLTDVIMPLMNGHELATRLLSVRPGTKVLYMSGYANDELAFHGIDRPEIAFIQKPFTASELAEKVDTLLSVSAERPRS